MKVRHAGHEVAVMEVTLHLAFSGPLIHVRERTRASTAGIAAAAARARLRRGRTGALRGDRKDRKLRIQLLAMTLGALGLILAVHQSLEFVIAVFTDVFKNGHGPLPDLRDVPLSII